MNALGVSLAFVGFASAFWIGSEALVNLRAVEAPVQAEAPPAPECLLTIEDTPEDFADLLLALPPEAFDRVVARAIERAGNREGL